MKTPMQELIEDMNEMLINGEGSVYALREKARLLLKKEKEVMSQVYADGGDWDEVPQPRFKNYYNQTFNTKER